jgi:Transposase
VPTFEHCSIRLPVFLEAEHKRRHGEGAAVLLVGIDWAERHHDVCVMAADGSVLARERITDGVAGWPGCTS